MSQQLDAQAACHERRIGVFPVSEAREHRGVQPFPERRYILVGADKRRIYVIGDPAREREPR